MSGSSPEAQVIEADPVSTLTPDASAAASSTANQDGENISLLDSVRESMKPETEQSPRSEPDQAIPDNPEKPEAQPEAAKAEGDPLGDLTEDELKKYGPKTQARMRQLLGQRREANDRAERVQAELGPKAQKFDEIDAFIRNNNLSNEDVATIFQIGASIRNDPFKALAQVEQVRDRLVEITGGKLPDDLQQRVNLGYISKEDALELNRARSQAAFNETRRGETERKTAGENEVAQQRAHIEQCTATADKWEASKQSADPDWKLKQPRIREKVELAVLKDGFPKTKDELVKLLDKFNAEVTTELNNLRPVKPAIRPVTQAASTRSNAEPADLLGHIKKGLAGG